VAAFRHQNLKTLRTLLDAFDPQQVAVLCSGQHKDKASGGVMVGFDVAHIHAHTFIEDRGFVLCVGFDGQASSSTTSASVSSVSARRQQHPHSRLAFKVFKSIPDRPATWRLEIPRADWYLSQDHFFDGPAAASSSGGDAVLRTLRLVGAKLLFKILGALLLENSLVVVGSSFPVIKEVVLCLLKLLRPFRWQHTFVPFLPIPSWRFLADSLHHHVQSQLVVARPKSDWRWGSPRPGTRSLSHSNGSSSHPASPPMPLQDEPPFLIGTMAETWHTCVERLKASSLDDRVHAIPAYVNVLNLDDVASFSAAKSSRNAVAFPRKLRKQFLERFDKVVKYRRKINNKAPPPPPPPPQRLSSSASSFSIRHSFSQPSSGAAKLSKDAAEDDRLVYDAACAAAFVTGLDDAYDRLTSLSAERAKKRQGKKKKTHSKRHDFKAWFSSTHEFDAYVDAFLDTAVYERYESDRASGTAMLTATDASGLLLSRSSSTTFHPSVGKSDKQAGGCGGVALASTSTRGLLSGARSFGSVSSNSSFNGHSSTHHQL
jgi:hypothetical protein